MKILVTGGAGFIGSNFIHYWLSNHPMDQVINFDKLTYAGNLENLKDLKGNPHYIFIKGDITNQEEVDNVMAGIDLVVNFAAESHVDRSIVDPLLFIKTNVLGTGVLLNSALKYKVKRFHHISTDEVYGHLNKNDPPFNEETKYAPRTPYAASKASSDHLARAYFETYGLPVTLTNCANNFGPYQDPEKLIPRFITNLIEGKKVPLMGKGENIRSWTYVEDHNIGLDLVLQNGEIGQTYLIGGEEKTNLEVTKLILKLLGKDESMIDYVPERLGHDFRYALDSSKIAKLGWKPKHTLEQALKDTVKWYQEHTDWWKPLKENRPIVDRVVQKNFNQS